MLAVSILVAGVTFDVNVILPSKYRLGGSSRPSMQGDLALTMAGKGQGKFDAVDWSLCDGLPRLTGALGWLACDIARFVPGGDHIVLFGTVDPYRAREGPPLGLRPQAVRDTFRTVDTT